MAYNEADWIEYAIAQARLLCDRLIICEGSQFVAFPDIPERSNDGTLDLINDQQKKHPGFIEVMPSVRDHRNYRKNQCDNFNRALKTCKVGDYFLPLDVDEYYSDAYIERMNAFMTEGQHDCVVAHGRLFAFSFDWVLDFQPDNPQWWSKEAYFKVTPALHFIPTHKSRGVSERYQDTELGLFHYTWLKPKSRMAVRMKTSGAYKNMVQWFNSSWDHLKLQDGLRQRSHKGKDFVLHAYNGPHPSVLDAHPWRHLDDVRKHTR